MHSSSSGLHFLSNDLFTLRPPSLPPPSSLPSPAPKKKRYKKPRKSKWSTGVIKKFKKKRPPLSVSSSSSSTSNKANSESGSEENGEMRAENGSADPSSSTASESSDGEHNHLTGAVNGYHQGLNGIPGIQNGVLVNGYHHAELLDLQPADSVPTGRLNLRDRTQTSKAPPNLKTVVNGVCLSKIGLYVYVLLFAWPRSTNRSSPGLRPRCCSFKALQMKSVKRRVKVRLLLLLLDKLQQAKPLHNSGHRAKADTKLS